MKIKDLMSIILDNQLVRLAVEPFYEQVYVGNFGKIPDKYLNYTIETMYSSTFFRHDYLILIIYDKPTTLKDVKEKEKEEIL